MVDRTELYGKLAIFGDASQLILLFGSTIAIIGFMAYATTKKGEMRNDWGKRLCIIGIGFSILGTNMTWFLEMIAYVFT